MDTIKPKKVVGIKNDPTFFIAIRKVNADDMQEFLCPEGKERYEASEERKIERKENLDSVFTNRLAEDSEEQLRYNTLVNSIFDYKDYDEYKYKTSFVYKVLKFLRLTK